jgi:hypothetical protein
VGNIVIDSLNPDARPIGDVAGRWISPDPLSEEFPSWSPYSFVFNNPVRFIDPTGMAPEDPLDYYNESGDRIGTDGVNDGRRAVVTDNSQARAIKRTNKEGGTTALSSVTSAIVLPSDTVLQESLNVLDRAVRNGGQREESSLVMNNGAVVRGETGPEPTIVNPQSASTPSTGPGSDGPTFSQYNTNVIVGPLGTITNVTQNPNGTLNIPNRPNGAAIYNRDSTPRIELKKKTIERILSPQQ